MEKETCSTPNLPSPTELSHKDDATTEKLSLMDKLLSPLIILAMVGGTLLSQFVPGVQEAFDTATIRGVSAPIAIGLIVMMWPVLTRVQWESLPKLFSSSQLWTHIILSVILNWIIGPFIMLGLAWLTLMDLPGYRTGVIMVGLARCIAMVAIWNRLARGNEDYCAILIVVNSLLQVVLYSPYSLLFVNTIGGSGDIGLVYGDVAISVLIYLGIPLVGGVLTRYTMIKILGRTNFEKAFIPYFSHITLLGLLYTIVVIFAYQGKRILHNVGPVFRVFVPLILYFVIMWTSTFALCFALWRSGKTEHFTYEMSVVQSFTAGSNNFELAIAVCIALWGVASEQALAATIGPLVEVPVLLALSWVALYFRKWFRKESDRLHVSV